jgi:hypothetical protein
VFLITEDLLYVAYDDDNKGRDRPLVLVMRKRDNGVEVIKEFKDEQAVKIYKLLTEVNGEEYEKTD